MGAPLGYDMGTFPQRLNRLASPDPFHGESPIITLAPANVFEQQSDRVVIETDSTVPFPSNDDVHHGKLLFGSVIAHADAYFLAFPLQSPSTAFDA